jgi:putative phosphoribosyl transferase
MGKFSSLIKNRRQAGLALAAKLQSWHQRPHSLVLALPRGGVEVGLAIAQSLELPLDVLVVRKLGVPLFEEFAMGAIASGGQTMLSMEVIKREGIPDSEVRRVIERESKELLRRERCYRSGHSPCVLHRQNVILVDDGMATGSTMVVAIKALRAAEVASITVAVPVLSIESMHRVSSMIDELVYLHQPEPFYAIGQWYEYFGQLSDDDVIKLLKQAHVRPSNNSIIRVQAGEAKGHQGDQHGI